MIKTYQNLSVATAGTALLLGMGAGFLSSLTPDINGCNLSPDNAGCVLNRPIDIQRSAETASEETLSFGENEE
ncbi:MULTISPECIES: hypothetical protein [Cyanophyceae]|uniref:hypothetical protein n=1 Tax=Cyanophyceae TaxID=3028117 RepID=UPI0016821FC2|nr:hypothetical protein [Trichocoleus sp. FACHB-40]MBD2003694.1 hypothetical protein [Trichocoleus sp. FACHB-40]